MPLSHPRTKLLPVAMFDFQREFVAVREPVLAAIETVCGSQRFILGPEVERFECSAANFLGVDAAVGCASGTDAIWLALAALKIAPRDVVITTPFSFFATVSAILRAGGKPVLVDIDERTFNLSPTALEDHFRRPFWQPARAAFAVMPVHLFGQCADMTAINALAKANSLHVVEDAAQAFGATWNGARGQAVAHAGALGDAAAFSFYPTKNLAAFGDAGMVTTNDADVAERARMLRAHGMRQRYFHDEVGWNSRLDTIQAAVLEVKLGRVEAGNARRRAIAALYDRLFAAAKLTGATTANGIVLPFTDPRAGHVFHQYVIRAPRRDELRAFLTENGIGSEVYYPLPLHLQPSLKDLGYRKGDFPVAERAAAEVLALPIYPELREDEVESVVEGVRRFYQG